MTTVLNKDGDERAVAYIPYDKAKSISNIKVTIYDEAGKRLRAFQSRILKILLIILREFSILITEFWYFLYTSVQYPYTVDFSYESEDKNTIFIQDFVPFHSIKMSLEEAQFKIINTSGIELRTKIYLQSITMRLL